MRSQCDSALENVQGVAFESTVRIYIIHLVTIRTVNRVISSRLSRSKSVFLYFSTRYWFQYSFLENPTRKILFEIQIEI
jgi:hypothetical protein